MFIQTSECEHGVLPIYTVLLSICISRLKIAQVAGEGKAVTRFTICGVQASEFTGIPATGKSAVVTAIGSQRIVDGSAQLHDAGVRGWCSSWERDDVGSQGQLYI